MKKTLIVVLAFGLLVAAFGSVGTAFAMSEIGKGPGNGGNGGGGNAGATSTNILSAYMTDAMASVLNLDPAVLATRLDAGETFYTVALAEGFAQEDLAALFASAQALATEMAAADGLIVQAQTQLNTNTATQSQLNDGTCDGTGDCLQIDPVPSLYTGANAGGQGRRGGR